MFKVEWESRDGDTCLEYEEYRLPEQAEEQAKKLWREDCVYFHVLRAVRVIEQDGTVHLQLPEGA